MQADQSGLNRSDLDSKLLKNSLACKSKRAAKSLEDDGENSPAAPRPFSIDT